MRIGRVAMLCVAALAGGGAWACAAGVTDPTTGCDAMSLRIRGRPQTPLLGGAALVRTVRRLRGVRLALSR